MAKKRRDFSGIKTHTIRGKRFDVAWRRPYPLRDEEPGKQLGACDHPETKGRKLHIYPHQDPVELLDTVIHEFIHGGLFDIEERAVVEICRDAKRFFLRMGIQIEFVPVKKSIPPP